MTMVSTDTVRAYAHCQDARCLGYRQEPVDGVRTTTVWTYLDLGGDLPGVERSSESVWFADETDAVCPQCEGAREISEQVRPEYPNISGHDPMGLFEFRGKTEGELRDLRHQRELDEVKRESEIKDLRAELAELKQLLTAQTRRGPGRPPKPTGPEA